MTSDQLQGNWKQIKRSVKEHWGKLTDDDLGVIAGKRDQLVGSIQERYGIAQEDAQRQVDDWTLQDADEMSLKTALMIRS
jgi:uncharacterized protein YjbJ (UPF0337 family)